LVSFGPNKPETIFDSSFVNYSLNPTNELEEGPPLPLL
jgi:hypothetical protein